jgi:hypothetical protein
MAHGVEDLAPIVATAGFADVQSGPMRFRSLGFVTARVASAGAAESPEQKHGSAVP